MKPAEYPDLLKSR